MVFVQFKGNDMKLTDIRNSVNEISAIKGLKMVVTGNTKEVEGIKLSKEMAEAMIDWFNSSPYGRKYPKAAKARLHISLGIMMSFGLERYAKFKGAKEELKYIKDLSKAMRDNVNEEEGVKHYTKDGKEWTGPTHKMPDGTFMTQNPHSDDSEKLFHKEDLDESSINENKYTIIDPKGNNKGIGLKMQANKRAKALGGSKKGYFVVPAKLALKARRTLEKFNFDFKNIKLQDKMSDLYFENTTSESVVNEDKFAGWIAGYNGKKIEIKKGEAKDLYNAKLLAIKKLKVPKSKVGLMFIKPAVDESVVNEAKYDIGMARKGNGLTIYNKAEEENGDYRNVALIDNKGKIKYLDKKIPSNVKKQIEKEAKKMMETYNEGTMKLTDLIKESFEGMRIQTSPSYNKISMREDEADREESSEMTTEQKQAFLEAVKSYKSFGESVYRKEGLSKVYESIRGLVEAAGKNMVKETEGSFDGITVSRHVKRMNESFKIFEKTLREVATLQQRLESSYDEIGETLGKYYEINETEETEIEEGNEFGAARTTAIANGDSEFTVDGKTYPVKDVSKDDKENAKEFKNESKGNTMKLKDLLHESFGFGELPSSKLMKMKVSAKDMLNTVKNTKVNEVEEVEEDVIKEGSFATWEMSFANMNLGGVKLNKKNVYKVKARNTVEAIKKAAKMAGVGDSWIATQTHSLKKIG